MRIRGCKAKAPGIKEAGRGVSLLGEWQKKEDEEGEEGEEGVIPEVV